MKPETLPVMYRHNKKAWMNSKLFECWLTKFNNRIKRQGRKVLLFIDNAPSHPSVQYSNVKVVFLPANTTSKCQPMDQGIIQTMKLKYRKRQLQHILSAMEKDKTKCGSELLKEINVLQAIYWINSAWKEVELSTIQKCFVKCGFKDIVTNDEDSDIDDDIPLSVVALANELFGCDFHDLVELDREVQTSDDTIIDWSKPADELLGAIHEEDEDVNDDDDDDDCDKENVTPVCTLSEAEHCIEKLRDFALCNGHNMLLNPIMEMAELTSSLRVSSYVKQKKISDFFK